MNDTALQRLRSQHESRRFILRPVSRRDLNYLYDLRREPGLQSLFSGPPPPNLEAQAAWFMRLEESGTAVYFLLFKKGSQGAPAVIGYTQISRIDWVNRQAELGIVLEAPQRGKGGAGPMAAALTCQVAFERAGLHALFASVHPGNTAALRGMCQFGGEPFTEESPYRKGGEQLHRITYAGFRQAIRRRFAVSAAWREAVVLVDSAAPSVRDRL